MVAMDGGSVVAGAVPLVAVFTAFGAISAADDG
jgi:hypothetical protein